MEACLQDSSRHDFAYQSNPYSSQTTGTLSIDRMSPYPMSKAIFVQITGSRPDMQSHRPDSPIDSSKKPLPDRVVIYVRHYINRAGRERTAAHVLEQGVAWTQLSSRLILVSARSPDKIGEVEFASHYSEADVSASHHLKRVRAHGIVCSSSGRLFRRDH